MEYKVFRIGDLFDVKKGKRLTQADMIPGKIKFIGATAENNGETARIANTEHLHQANTITVTYNGSVGEVFYQDEPFWASDDVNVLYPKFEMTIPIALYVITAVRYLKEKYSYTHKWVKEFLENDEIFLPVTDEGTPDWEYMQERISVLEQERISVLEQYLLAAGLDDYKLATEDQETLNKKAAFKSFRIGDLFVPLKGGYIGTGKKIGSAMKARSEEYCIPLTCAKLGDNGIMYWGKKGDFRTYTNAISIIADGAVSAGLVYAQPEEAGVYSHSYFIKLENVEVPYRTNLYLASVLNKVLYPKYSRERPPRWENKVENDSILLPVTAEGQPDYTYMEQYIRAQEKLAIRDAIQLKDRIIEETKRVIWA